MGRIMRVLGVGAMMAVLALNVAGAQEKKIQIALTGTVMMGGRFDNGDMGGYIGPGARLDLSLSRFFMISPELTYILNYQSVTAACTFNLTFGRSRTVFIGLGPMTSSATNDGHSVTCLKIHIGIKSRHFLAAASHIRTLPSASSFDERTALLGLTVGLIF